ncbi:MAG: methyltransferase family protein [Kiloniellaceae bacterium]
MSEPEGTLSTGARANDKAGVLVRPPFVYLGALVLAFGIDRVWPVSLLPAGVQYSGGTALIVLGALVMALAVRRFRAAGTNVETGKPTTAVVTGGPYGYSRNPIYLSLTAIAAGIGIAADNLWVLALLAPVLAVVRYGVVAREERYLERKFGEDYRRYRASVRRWL